MSEAVARIVDTEPDMRCVGQVANVSDVLPVARESSAQALVLDLSLTGGSSLQLIEELVADIPGLHIVVFSSVLPTPKKLSGRSSAAGRGVRLQGLRHHGAPWARYGGACRRQAPQPERCLLSGGGRQHRRGRARSLELSLNSPANSLILPLEIAARPA
ncbi:MAG: hypothetical protein WDO56_21345 [Gammaproteobacteria bacterium]